VRESGQDVGWGSERVPAYVHSQELRHNQSRRVIQLEITCKERSSTRVSRGGATNVNRQLGKQSAVVKSIHKVRGTSSTNGHFI
jgi:hypothetical protein